MPSGANFTTILRAHTKRPKSTSIHQSRRGASTSGSQKVPSWPSIAFAASAKLVPAARIPPCTPSPDTKFGASSTALICSRMRCGRTPSGSNCTVPAAISHSAQSPSSTATRSDSMRNPWGHAATAISRAQATSHNRVTRPSPSLYIVLSILFCVHLRPSADYTC